MQNIVIWGAGKIGKLAYMYYKDKCNIAFFVDSNPEKWNTLFFNIPIYKPETVKQFSYVVVVALKIGRSEVIKRIKDEFNMKFKIFDVEEIEEPINIEKEMEIDKNSIVVDFCGGLGNQMFQYAFLKAQSITGKKIYANISSYNIIGRMPFQLLNVFSSISMQFINNSSKKNLININDRTKESKKFVMYIEPVAVKEVKQLGADMDLLNVTGGIFQGYFQTYKYAELVKNELIQDFQFDLNGKEDLVKFSKSIKNKNYISVHIRRGDYLLDDNSHLFGNICTKRYYLNAIEYLRKRFPKSKVCFFSNDIEWVKDNFEIRDAIYIEKEMFMHYEDWYDMYLMSICQHNIIANSTFSWWGAWLNQNPEKIVIAPKKWINECIYSDIYPPNWINM